MTEKTIYIIIASFIIAIDLFVSISTFKRKQKNTGYFGGVLLAAAFQEIFYTLALVANSYFIAKLCLAAFFSSVTVMLFFLTIHTEFFTDADLKTKRTLFIVLGSISLLDIICEMSNPFNEIAIGYNYLPEHTLPLGYIPHILYNLHLAFCYLMMLIIFVRIIYKIVRTPSVYRIRYYTMLSGLIIALAINCVCIIFQTHGLLDYSQIAYCIMGLILYWDLFYNDQNYMLNSVRQMILDDLEHPIILFGQNNITAMRNEAAAFLIPNWNPREKYPLSDFLMKNSLNPALEYREENHYFQWIDSRNGKLSTYRVDYNILKDKKSRIIGRMFVFTDTSLETDILTGFTSKSAFERHFSGETPSISYPAVAAVFDINRLALINKERGNEAGDTCIQKLAQIIVRNCPKDSYFARLDNADLVAVIPNISAEQMRNYLKLIKLELTALNEKSRFEIQSAFIAVTEESPSILKAVEEASFSMRSRKMMDRSSAHSSLLDSLAQTLLESDDSTEAHVSRTQKLGEQLGKRLGLSDLDLSNLSLLCLLHDIGKLGIPLEILNKPGRFSKSEWEIMKDHVFKGYRIAHASRELDCIADYILHHHEAWDGKGYPDGLKQENIPLLSRIIAVVDAYDAMVNERPYHKAISDAEARNELKRCAGKQFDPYLVSEFIHLLEEVQPLESQEIETAPKITHNLPRGAYPLKPKELIHAQVRPIEYSRYVLDENNVIIEIDETFTEITGYDQSDLEKFHLSQDDLVPAEDREEYTSKVAKRIDSDGYAYLEHRIRRKDGSYSFVLCFGTPNYDVISKKMRSEIIVLDISHTHTMKKIKDQEQEKLKNNMERLESSMRKDLMTGLLNHASFINDIENELLKDEQKVALLLLDVDYFKQFNDSYGHSAGDDLLKGLASSLNEAVQPYGFAGRLGGDEFAAALIFPEDSNVNEKIVKYTSNIFSHISQNITSIQEGTTISVGVTVSDPDHNCFKDMYLVADEALYISKRAGRNRYTIR